MSSHMLFTKPTLVFCSLELLWCLRELIRYSRSLHLCSLELCNFSGCSYIVYSSIDLVINLKAAKRKNCLSLALALKDQTSKFRKVAWWAYHTIIQNILTNMFCIQPQYQIYMFSPPHFLCHIPRFFQPWPTIPFWIVSHWELQHFSMESCP